MPIYEYVCQKCGEETEKLQKLSDAPLKDCPSCEQPSLKRKISAAGFRLAGGGWYETDFKPGDRRRNIAGDAKDSKKEDGSGKSGGKSTGDGAKKQSDSGKNDSKPAVSGAS